MVVDERVQKVATQVESSKASTGAAGQRRVTIDPITRLEGHGKIEIFLDSEGEVERAYLQVPELRGFEVFSIGRPAEEMPQITSRICGVCPMAHHMAATKALDDLYQVDPPSAAKKVRELIYNAFVLEDHALHVYVLGGPDFIVGPDAPAAARNVLGVIQKVGVDVGKRVIGMRRRLRELISAVAGKVVHPVFGLPGGVAKPITTDQRAELEVLAKDSVDFALFTLKVFKDVVLANDEYVKLITSDAYTHRTCYMGMVDEQGRPNFYDGRIRVVDPKGQELARFAAQSYLEYVAEHVEPWSYTKFNFFKPRGWKGFVDGDETSIYSVAPLARLNVASGMATPKAHEAFQEYFKTLGAGAGPVHHTLANHWARVIEMVYAAERFSELANDPELSSSEVRTLPSRAPRVGVGVVEAPRGTLFHHYESDERGVVTKANLVVATQNNSARIACSVEKAARSLIHHGEVSEGLLNRVEMAFRAYDPCHGCATHSLPGQMPLVVRLHDPSGAVLHELRR